MSLHCENISYTELAERFGTPLYVYSQAELDSAFARYQTAFAALDPLICYAVKANGNLSVIRRFAELGSGFDIVSGGELARVLAAGGRADKTIFSGVGKSAAEIEFALKSGIKCFNVESLPELDRINEIAGRLKTAAAALNLSLPDDAGQQIRRHLAELPGQGAYRVKAALFSDGLQLSHAPLSDLPPNQSVILSDTALPERDFLRRFKTTHRETLDQGWRQAEAQGAFDSLFFNRAGELLEGGRSSVFVRFGSEWHTPPLELDILDGIMRRQILRQPQQYLGTSRVFESRISRTRLMQADEIRLCNALRGLFAVRLK